MGGPQPKGVRRLTVKDGPEVEEEDGSNAARVQRGSLGPVLGIGNFDVGADEPHAQASADGANQKESATAEMVDQVQQPDKGDDGLDYSEDARGQESRVGTGDADAPEHGRGIVVDRVDSAQGL